MSTLPLTLANIVSPRASVNLIKVIPLTRSFSEIAYRQPNPEGPVLGALRSCKVPLQQGDIKFICTCGISKNQVRVSYGNF